MTNTGHLDGRRDLDFRNWVRFLPLVGMTNTGHLDDRRDLDFCNWVRFLPLVGMTGTGHLDDRRDLNPLNLVKFLDNRCMHCPTSCLIHKEVVNADIAGAIYLSMQSSRW
jgi:hypothetical protein